MKGVDDGTFSDLGFDNETILEKYAKKFTNFKERKWYAEWLIELENFLKEIKKSESRG